MNKLLLATRKFLRDEEGVTAIEYALIAALIAVVIAVTVGLVGTELNAVFQKVLDALTGTSTTGG